MANGTRPHPELGVLGRFRVAGQMFSQTALVHVVFTAHRTRVVRGPALGHVRAGADIGVTCNEKTVSPIIERDPNTAVRVVTKRIDETKTRKTLKRNHHTHSARRPATRWSDRCGALSCVPPAIRCPRRVCDTAGTTWCSRRPSRRRAVGARPCGVRLPENKKNVPENNNKKHVRYSQ